METETDRLTFCDDCGFELTEDEANRFRNVCARCREAMRFCIVDYLSTSDFVTEEVRDPVRNKH